MYSTVALPNEQKAGLEAGARFYATEPSDLLNIGSLLSDLIKESKNLAEDEQAPRAVSPLAA